MTDTTKPERTPERCATCSNWLSICGHDLPFAERIKSVSIDRTSLRTKDTT